MKHYELTIQQKRTEALYEREVRRAVYQLIREEELPPLPISYCKVDRKFQTLKIYVSFSEKKEEERKLLETFNKKYTSIVSHMLASTRRFRKIPHLMFLVDKKLEEINRIEELIKSN